MTEHIIKICIITSLSLFLNFSGLQAQQSETRTIRVFLKEALENNPKLKSYRALVESAEARIPQVEAWEDPQIGFEFFSTPVTSLNPIKDGRENDIYIQQMIPFPGKKALMGEMAEYAARVAEQSADTYARQIIADVKKTYAMLYSAQRRLAVNKENQELLKQIIESATARYAVGLSVQADVLRAQVELEKLKNEHASLEWERRSAESMMNALRGFPPTEPIGQVAEPPLSEPPKSVDDLISAAIQFRPEIKSMEFEIAMRKTEQAVWRKERLPDFMVRGMYKAMTFNMPDHWSLMIGINIPIAPWARGKYSGKIEQAEADTRAGEQALVDMKNMIGFEVSESWSALQTGWSQIVRYRTTMLPQSRQALESTLAQFQTNIVDFFTLLDTYRMENMLSMEYYMLIGEYYSNFAKLERAVGQELFDKETLKTNDRD